MVFKRLKLKNVRTFDVHIFKLNNARKPKLLIAFESTKLKNFHAFGAQLHTILHYITDITLRYIMKTDNFGGFQE